MKVTMNNNDAVPIIFTHRTVTRMPKVNIKKRFVGFVEGFKTLAVKAIDLIDQTFWTEDREVIDPGESKVVHYAVDVEDDSMEPERVLLIATKLHGNDRPSCGAHFEVVKVLDDKPKTDDVIRAAPEVVERPDDRLGKAKLVGERPRPIPENTAPKLPRPTRFGIDIGPSKHNIDKEPETE